MGLRSAGQSTMTGTICSAATYGANRSRCSTPFCSTATGVFHQHRAPATGRRRLRHRPWWRPYPVDRLRLFGLRENGRLDSISGRISSCMSLRRPMAGVSITSSFSGLRTHNTSSCPADCSSEATTPPIAPAPTIAIRAMRHSRITMARHIGIVACSAEGAALCYRTICVEGAEWMGEHAHPEISMHTHSLAD